MGVPKVKHIRASVVRGGGGDYHDVDDGHWIDDHIATPMARYPEYRASRRAFGIMCLAPWSSRSKPTMGQPASP